MGVDTAGQLARGRGLRELSQVEVLPHPLNTQAFEGELARTYPVHLRDAGIEGTIQVRFRVELDGTTTNRSVTRSINSGFDGATLRAIRVLRFRPAKVGGRPVRAWVEQPIRWSIDGRSPALPELNPR